MFVLNFSVVFGKCDLDNLEKLSVKVFKLFIVLILRLGPSTKVLTIASVKKIILNPQYGFVFLFDLIKTLPPQVKYFVSVVILIVSRIVFPPSYYDSNISGCLLKFQKFQFIGT